MGFSLKSLFSNDRLLFFMDRCGGGGVYFVANSMVWGSLERRMVSLLFSIRCSFCAGKNELFWLIEDFFEPDIEDERGIGADFIASAALPPGQVGGNHKAELSALLHQRQPFL